MLDGVNEQATKDNLLFSIKLCYVWQQLNCWLCGVLRHLSERTFPCHFNKKSDVQVTVHRDKFL